MPKKSQGLDERALVSASINLSTMFFAEAIRLAEAEGFAWRASEDAPNTFEGVLDAYAHSKQTGERYPVLTHGSETTILASAEVNHAFRFVHDLTHVRLELGFDPDSEMYVAVEHLNLLRRSGYAVGSLEWHLLHADTIGQIVAGCILGRFVIDQRAFDFDCVAHGLRAAIAIEEVRGKNLAASSTITSPQQATEQSGEQSGEQSTKRPAEDTGRQS
jgi:hypothetical protein